jgi:hypothetical protein
VLLKALLDGRVVTEQLPAEARRVGGARTLLLRCAGVLSQAADTGAKTMMSVTVAYAAIPPAS